MHQRWTIVVASIAAMIFVSGCGRVDLEDLTPEAFKTQQAQEAASQPTVATGGQSGSAGATSTGETTSGNGGPAIQGDIAGGAALYNAQCSGCHEGGRAESLRGQVFDPAEVIPKLRTGEGFSAPHPAYRPTDIAPLSDSDLQDIFAYLASQ